MIAGAGRSGSTLLERILATAPDAVTVGELTEVWRRGVIEDELCGCGERFSACDFWSEIGERAFDGWSVAGAERMIELERRLGRAGVPLSLAAGISPGLRSALDEYGAALLRIYEAVAASTGARTIIDASKWPRHLFVLRTIPVELRVLHLFRDPRAVAFSWSRPTSKPHLAGGGTDRGMRTYRPTGSALRWLAFNLLVDLAARLGTPTRRIRYERLVQEPERAIAAAIGHIDGLRVDALCLDGRSRTVDLSPSHGVAGNPMRFRHGALELRDDDRWRSEMRSGQRLGVGALCAPLHRRYVRSLLP